MKIFERILPVSLALVAGSLLMGCAPEYRLELTTDDHGADVIGQHIAIPVGNAIGVTPLENDDPVDLEVDIELVSSAPSIMDVAATGDPREFVLWGISAGIADVEVLIDGELEDIIEVEVVPRED